MNNILEKKEIEKMATEAAKKSVAEIMGEMSMFKVTDLIVAKGEHDLNGLLPKVVQVHSINEDDVYCEDDSGMGCWILKSHLHLWRYAESEEIVLGHRIDNDMGDDSHIENHVSPNCKQVK